MNGLCGSTMREMAKEISKELMTSQKGLNLQIFVKIQLKYNAEKQIVSDALTCLLIFHYEESRKSHTKNILSCCSPLCLSVFY